MFVMQLESFVMTHLFSAMFWHPGFVSVSLTFLDVLHKVQFCDFTNRQNHVSTLVPYSRFCTLNVPLCLLLVVSHPSLLFLEITNVFFCISTVSHNGMIQSLDFVSGFFNVVNTCKVHPCYMNQQLMLLKLLNNIPLYG